MPARSSVVADDLTMRLREFMSFVESRSSSDFLTVQFVESKKSGSGAEPFLSVSAFRASATAFVMSNETPGEQSKMVDRIELAKRVRPKLPVQVEVTPSSKDDSTDGTEVYRIDRKGGVWLVEAAGEKLPAPVRALVPRKKPKKP